MVEEGRSLLHVRRLRKDRCAIFLAVGRVRGNKYVLPSHLRASGEVIVKIWLLYLGSGMTALLEGGYCSGHHELPNTKSPRGSLSKLSLITLQQTKVRRPVVKYLSRIFHYHPATPLLLSSNLSSSYPSPPILSHKLSLDHHPPSQDSHNRRAAGLPLLHHVLPLRSLQPTGSISFSSRR
ncbi:hypothetical protein L873DRAFT_1275464 [Choiromyces venosus 120613-1]|uniref:Uncharacterized protein n=1 Tax=Choiromyces venosus 120613-1 TaxID=1336337 RepID=A0A3N4K5Y4_9PEZI|nr:hypothetical protein L873DRAFT_1275464 [Choiromyces venosus 120613-1]